MKRGHDVSYTVSEPFAPLIRSIGATPVAITVLENREQVIPNLFNERDHRRLHDAPEKVAVVTEAMNERTRHSVLQLELRYRDQLPDFVVRDDVLERGGREFAARFGIPSALLRSQFIEKDLSEAYPQERRVLVTVPEFFQKIDERTPVPTRFRFVGFPVAGRALGFRPWTPLQGARPRVLISPTTGLLQQTEFCRNVIDAFRDSSWEVVLSISGARDRFSAIDPAALEDLPANVHINQQSANFDILPNVGLYIGQGGQGGALEAVYHGVPQIVVPASAYHYFVGQRIDELGLGVCLPVAEFSATKILDYATRLIADPDVRTRLERARASMRSTQGAELAADAIEEGMMPAGNR